VRRVLGEHTGEGGVACDASGEDTESASSLDALGRRSEEAGDAEAISNGVGGCDKGESEMGGQGEGQSKSSSCSLTGAKT
jgi:hypothetical protein